MTLPPGQRAIDGFPRFGTHLHQAPPAVPARPVIEIAGAVTEAFSLELTELAGMPRRELTADFHCVAGWSATGLRWEGVAFAAFYASVLAPALAAGATVTHVVFEGLDGYRSIATLEDALADDVLIAEHLDGRPLGGDHGAPARLVSPSQYGFMSTKHLSRIELHTAEPDENYGSASRYGRALMVAPLFARHPRSRVWQEERNGRLPNWVVRPVYRAFRPPIALLSRQGRR